MKALTSKQIVIIVVIMIVAVIVFLMLQSRRRNELIAFAESYVSMTFDQEMVFADFCRNTFTFKTGIYSVSFSLKSNPDFIFEVFITRSQEAGELQVRRDNFFEVLIHSGLMERYIPIAHSIWGGDARVGVNVSSSLYIDVPDYLNEHSTVDDILYSDLNDRFGLFIDVPYFFTYESKDEEVEKVYQLIQTLQEREYLPSRVRINRFSNADLSERESFWAGSVTSNTTFEDVRAEVERSWVQVT